MEKWPKLMRPQSEQKNTKTPENGQIGRLRVSEVFGVL